MYCYSLHRIKIPSCIRFDTQVVLISFLSAIEGFLGRLDDLTGSKVPGIGKMRTLFYCYC